MKSPFYELVLPCYNEAPNLEALINRAVNAAIKYKFTPDTFQLIMVENGSTDSSSMTLDSLKKTELGRWFKIVSVKPNEGYGNGILTGLKNTSAPIIGWTHADQQCDPEDAFKAFEILKESKNKNILIKGKRSGRNKKEVFTSRVFEFFARLILNLKLNEINAQPKVFYRDLFTLLKNPPKSFALDLYLLYTAKKNNIDIISIPVLFPARIHGLSNWAYSNASRYKTFKGMIDFMKVIAKSEGRL
jgi:glycosyltransferase involved in cell wall biosynthesis